MFSRKTLVPVRFAVPASALALTFLATLPSAGFADDQPRGRTITTESRAKTTVQVKAALDHTNTSYSVGITARSSAQGEPQTSTFAAAPVPDTERLSPSLAATWPGQSTVPGPRANSSAQFGTSQAATGVGISSGVPASSAGGPGSNGASAGGSGGASAYGGATGSFAAGGPGSRAATSELTPGGFLGASPNSAAGGGPAPRVYTFEELLSASRRSTNPAIPTGLGGAAPIYSHNTAFDDLGNVWYVPALSPPDTRSGEPASQAQGEATGPRMEPSVQGTIVPALDPREVALEVLHEIPLPDIHVRMNPATGLVALPSWFWVENYDGQAVGGSRTVELPPLIGPEVPPEVAPADDPRRQGQSFTVEVRVWPTQFRWSFGDGTTRVSGTLGQRYPEESEVQHTYEHSSLREPGGFPVRLTVAFAADYRVGGGAPQALPPAERTYEARYRVQEIQTVLTRRP